MWSLHWWTWTWSYQPPFGSCWANQTLQLFNKMKHLWSFKICYKIWYQFGFKVEKPSPCIMTKIPWSWSSVLTGWCRYYLEIWKWINLIQWSDWDTICQLSWVLSLRSLPSFVAGVKCFSSSGEQGTERQTSSSLGSWSSLASLDQQQLKLSPLRLATP